MDQRHVLYFLFLIVILLCICVLCNVLYVPCSVCQLFSTFMLLCTTWNCTNADSGVSDRIGAYFSIIFPWKVWKMANNHLTYEELLENYGNTNNLKLDNILDPPDADEEEIHIMRPSHYFALEKLPIHLQTVGNFNILSINTHPKHQCQIWRICCFLRDCQTVKCTFPCNLSSRNLA